MAETKTTTGRKKKENVNTEVKETSKEKKLKEENDALTEMLAKMQKQIDELQKQAENKEPANQVVIKQNSDLTRSVKVVSLLSNIYNLNTQPYGKGGKTYQFNGFGDSHMIKFSDMQDILSLYLTQFEKGYAVLTNKQDYEDLGVGYIYDEVLSKEKVEKLIKLDDDKSIDTIIDMEEDMQEKIVNIIAENISKGVSYDYNKIKKLEDAGLQINEVVELLEASKSKG